MYYLYSSVGCHYFILKNLDTNIDTACLAKPWPETTFSYTGPDLKLWPKSRLPYSKYTVLQFLYVFYFLLSLLIWFLANFSFFFNLFQNVTLKGNIYKNFEQKLFIMHFCVKSQNNESNWATWTIKQKVLSVSRY